MDYNGVNNCRLTLTERALVLEVMEKLEELMRASLPPSPLLPHHQVGDCIGFTLSLTKILLGFGGGEGGANLTSFAKKIK